MEGIRSPSSTFTGSETAANLNSANAKTVTVKAKWKSNCNDGLSSVGSYKNFDYTGSVQTFNACAGRTYKLEVWGAQGAPHGSLNKGVGGMGGYSVGAYTSSNNTDLYIFVGGQGIASCTVGVIYGGWNGGGGVYNYGGCNKGGMGTGGGATDISTVNSSVSTDSYGRYTRTTSSYNSRIIVAGGGGGVGAAWGPTGGSGGGYTGGNGSGSEAPGPGGTQSAGGGHVTQPNYNWSSDYPNSEMWSASGFGYGESGKVRNQWWKGTEPGGGGWYGGGGSQNHGGYGGGGGSGYIGGVSSNSTYSITKQMYQYSIPNCTASSSTSTKTTCTSSTGAHVANAANTGNGYAKITYLGT